jgi:hypothetical protein
MGEGGRRPDEGIPFCAQKILLDRPHIPFHICSRRFWKGGTMSTMSLHCQNRVQRLRDFGGDTLWSSGSRGLAPGILRSLLSLCCSNSRRGFVSPVDWDWQFLPVRLCECESCQTPSVKSRGQHGFGEIPAKIAAFQGWALSRIHYIFYITACWLGVRTGTFPPFSFHGPP